MRKKPTSDEPSPDAVGSRYPGAELLAASAATPPVVPPVQDQIIERFLTNVANDGVDGRRVAKALGNIMLTGAVPTRADIRDAVVDALNIGTTEGDDEAR
jgi:hypothetical protein